MLEEIKSPCDFGLYREALAADEEYQRALVKVYGLARAGDARYGKHSSEEVLKALDRKLKADASWLAESGRVLGIRGR